MKGLVISILYKITFWLYTIYKMRWMHLIYKIVFDYILYKMTFSAKDWEIIPMSGTLKNKYNLSKMESMCLQDAICAFLVPLVFAV
jgi:hypothetical protein